MLGLDSMLCEFMIIVKNRSKRVACGQKERVACVGFSSESDFNSSVSSIWCAFVSESQKVALLLFHNKLLHLSVHTTRNTNTRCGGKVTK